MRITVVVAVVLWSGWVQAKTVAFSGPPTFRAPLAKALESRGFVPLDLSALDEALFGPGGFQERYEAGKPPAFDAVFPDEVKRDLQAGLAGCAARGPLRGPARHECAEHLVSATWQRHLRRLAVELVIELRPLTPLPMVEWGSYRPGDDFLLGSVIETVEPSAAVAELVEPAVSRQAHPYAVRARLETLPGKAPLPRPRLSDGTPQDLAPVELNKQCVYPARLAVSPRDVPFAATLDKLWSTSVDRQLNPYAKPVGCKLALTPLRFSVTCGHFTEVLDLPVGVDFGSPALQAMTAERTVVRLLEEHCFKD